MSEKTARLISDVVGFIGMALCATAFFLLGAQYVGAQRYEFVGMGARGVVVFDKVAGDLVVRKAPYSPFAEENQE